MERHNVILLLGSNIRPAENIPQALQLLAARTRVVAQSRVWETAAVGSQGPNFLNVAVKIETRLNPQELKNDLIHPIEQQLGRLRSSDKFMPRTMDIDIILYDDQVLDETVWCKAFVAIPVSELAPNLPQPGTHEPLSKIASQLKSADYAELFELSEN